MSAPRFAPRDFTTSPPDFGSVARLTWAFTEGDQHDLDRLAASQLQHSYAVVIRRKVKLQYKTLNKYCAAADIPTDRFGKMLGGKLLMRFEDTVRAERLLGQIHADAINLMAKVVAAHNR